MANDTITARLKIQAEGLREADRDTKSIHDNLVNARRAADALNRAQADTARKAAARNPRENLEYTQMRGIGQQTGAAGRDFADQARGLGPLIRLYAAFAANVFALSAAFGVLRNAADTTNLIAGLNTLGATSGKALGTVAKQLAEASDGAISLRDAMSSVAMTSSAGMTSQNILRLGTVAKNASLALGVNMPDALNRLSRGIVKLEPELLDELGIFTKIEPATQAYALQLGKAVSQLTDFERRQAFANAVLKEGEDKFAALADQKANPYDKLLASLQNVAYSGLELLNKVLKPIVEVLASSPTALALGLAAVIAAILRRAIPAISDLRAAFGEKLQEGIQRTQDKIEGLKASYKALADYTIKQAGMAEDAKMAKLEQSEKKILDFYERTSASRFAMKQGKMVAGQTPEFGQIIQQNPLQLTQDNLQQLKAAHEDYVSKVSAGNIKLTAEVKDRIALEKDFIVNLEKQLAGEKDFSTLRSKTLAQAKEGFENSKLAQAFELDQQRLRAKGEKDEIVRAAVARANTLGIGIAWKLLKIDIDNASNSVEKFAARTALVQGALGIVGGKLLSVLNSVGGALTAISIGAAVFSIFESIFSKNEKQIRAFKGSVDAANESTENTKRTLAELDRAGLSKSLTDTAISLSNAFEEISSSAQKLVADSRLAKEASTGWFDTVVEAFKSFAGYGIDQQVAKGLSKQLTSALDILSRSGIDDKYREQFKQLLQVKDLSAGTVEDALSKVGEDVKNRFTSLLESARKELARTRSDLESFKDASDKAVKSYQEFLQSTANTNPLFKLGESMEILADSMITSMRRGTLGIQAAFEEFSKDPKKAALFGKEFIQEFVAVEEGFKEQSNAVREYTRLQAQLQSELESVQIEEQKILKAREDARKQGKVGLIDKFFGSGAFQGEEALDKSTKLKEQIKAIQEATLKIPTDQIEKARGLFVKGLDVAFEQGAKYITIALGQAQEKAANAIAKANSILLTGERATDESTRLKLKEIDTQITAVKVNLDLIRQNELLVAEMAALRASVEYSRVSADKNATDEEKRYAFQNKVATGLVAEILGGQVNEKNLKSLAGQRAVSNELVTTPTGTNPDEIVSQVRAATGAVRRKEAEQQSRLIELGGERRAAGIEGAIQGERARLEDLNKRRRLENETNQIINARQGIFQSIAGITSEELVKTETNAERAALINRQNVELSNIRLAINQNDAKFDETKEIRFDNERKYQQGILDLTIGKNKAEIENFDIQAKLKALQPKLQDIQREAEVAKSNRDLLNAKQEASLEITRAQFTSTAELYDLDKQFVANKVAELDIERANFEAKKQRAEIEASLGEKRLEVEAKVKALGLDGVAYQQRLQQELQRVTDISNNQLNVLEQERIKRIELLNIQRQQTLEQEKIAFKTYQSTTFASTLAAVFGTTGEKLGNISSTLIDFNQKQEQGQKALASITNERVAAEELLKTTSEKTGEKDVALMDKINSLRQAESRQTLKNRDTELAANAKLLGDAKKLFKEKTGAYKVLSALEKAYHVMRMVHMGMELALELKNIAVSLGAKAGAEIKETMLSLNGTLSRMPFMIGEIYGKTIGQLGVFGPPVAAALVALAFGALGGKSKGGSVNTTGLTADDMNAVAGTGQEYVNNKLVMREGGVVGDPTAVADSITSSIESLSRNFFNILNSDSSKVVRSLRGVEENTDKTVRALLGEVSGFAGTKQSPFGTMEQTVSSKKWNWWTGGFDKKTVDTKIISAGIRIEGQLDDLINQTGNTVLERWENVLTTVTKSSWWGLKNSTSQYLNRISGQLDPSIRTAISDTLVSFKQTLQGAAIILEGSTDRVNDVLKDFQIQINTNLQGLSGEEAIAKLSGEFSRNLNMAVEKAYPWIKAFTKTGEEYAEAAMRIANDSENVRYGLRMIGVSLGELDTYTRTLFEQDLIDQFGDLDKFATSINYYVENFIDASTRYNFTFDRLTEAFADAELALPKSKAEYISLVDALKESSKTSSKSKEQLVALLKYSEAYNKLLEDNLALKKEEIDNLKTQADETQATITKFQDFAKSLREFRSGLLLGTNSILTPLEKYSRAGSDFQTILNKALTGDVDAYGKLQAASNEFLTASQKVYASGPQYIQDFNTVTQALEQAEVFATSKATIDQLQLDGINAQITLLSSIDQNIAKATGGTTATARARGGLTQGLALVGEMGPELVDFNTSGRVYTATQTQGMFNTNQTFNEMIKQIQALKAEISTLRRDQQKQTGDLIITNYDATNKLGEQIAEAVVDAVIDSTWKDRTKVEII